MHWETSVFGLTSLGGMDGPHRQQLLKVKALLLSSATLQNQNFHSCVGDLCIQNKATNYSYITLNERHMSRQRTIYHLIVDRSGSMSDCIDATINGFNEQINRIRSIAMEFPEQDIRIGYTIFNFSIDMPAVAQDLNTITPLSRSNYVPAGSTALYDAIGKTTLQLEAFTDHHSDLPVTYVVVVLTDGYENASQMFTLQNIRSMIYILFLRHPEGIYISSLSEHKKALYDIYSRISSRGMMEDMRQRIDELTNVLREQASVKISRIKRAFTDAIGHSLADHYIIQGDNAERKRIKIDRGMVVGANSSV